MNIFVLDKLRENKTKTLFRRKNKRESIIKFINFLCVYSVYFMKKPGAWLSYDVSYATNGCQ